MRRLPLLLLVLAGGSWACGDDGPGDAERFCSEVSDNTAAIVGVPETPDQADDLLDLYRDIADVAPLAIEEEWNVLVVNLETASTVDVDDPASEQRAVASAYAAERSAVAVHDWLLRNCGVDLGPVATVGPAQPVAPPPPTTAPPG